MKIEARRKDNPGSGDKQSKEGMTMTQAKTEAAELVKALWNSDKTILENAEGIMKQAYDEVRRFEAMVKNGEVSSEKFTHAVQVLHEVNGLAMAAREAALS